jgi:2-methylisocitrate lyase-like PEP mutase family enzyme
MIELMSNTNARAARFRELHQRPGVFLIPNPWDSGSAKILAGLGFEALATSSAASAAVRGRRDGRMARDDALAHAGEIVNATGLPVSADLENGFADSPGEVAETIRLAANVGLVGCSIEDATARDLYDFELALERIAAAAQAAAKLPFAFTLTARAENYLRNNPDLDDTIRRLVAYERAGADVLFAPGLPDLGAVRAVCSAISKPVNFMVGMRGKSFSMSELADAGVKRISFGSSLYRASMAGLVEAAAEIREKGTFGYLEKAMTTGELYQFIPE